MILRYIALGFLLVQLKLLSAPAAEAQCPQSLGGRLVLHLADTTSTIACGPSSVTCESGLTVSGELNRAYYVFVILLDWYIFETQGLREVQFGVDYDAVVGSGVDVSGFQACTGTTTMIGNWPEPGSQIRITYPFCIDPDANPVPLVLGWFRVIAHTPGSLSLGSLGPNYGQDQPGIVSRLILCDQTVKLLDPVNQGAIGLGGAIGNNPCTLIADPFEGPCCLPNQTCQEYWSVACCWDQGGRRLDYMSTCAQCATPVLPNTWGRLKSRYE